ncbi:arf-GAP with coiled-coil, ANK repeat and PH domain-containing protein 3-like isoform X2 [Schistocerca gregaria]|nr:arf-GAP with coiled-coil, ANK repeat and PH domain-containing protein 3-like isoform X2 [Schistocerca gregaria]
MLLCSVRPAPHQNRNFCFKLIAPQKTLTLQAESEALMNEWVEKLKTCISAQLKGMSMNRNNPLTNATKESDARNLLNPDFLELGSSLEKVYRYSERDRANCLEMIKNLFISDPSNEQCVDCGDKLPTWVSINLGALMCLECSGIHRALGTHISRVKSIVLDELEFSTILLIGSIGNSNLNSIYDPQGLLVLKPDSSRKQREAVIKAKYEQRIMVPKYGNKDLEADGKEYVDVSSEHIDETASLQAELAHTIKSGNVLDVLRLYAQGADLNYCYHDDFSKYPIHYAVNVGSIEVLEFLIQNGANMNVQDDYKKTPLHYAVVENSLCAAFLCKHKANIDLLDADNNMPIDIALKFQNANSLTLLRLIRLARECEREESKQFLAELDVFIMDTYNRELSQQQGSGSVEQAEGLAT